MYTLEKKENTETFLQALSNLNLPQKLQEVSKKISTSSKVSIGKRSIQMTNFNPSNPAHMKEMINLSNFVNKVLIYLCHSLFINIFRNLQKQDSENWWSLLMICDVCQA